MQQNVRNLMKNEINGSKPKFQSLFNHNKNIIYLQTLEIPQLSLYLSYVPIALHNRNQWFWYPLNLYLCKLYSQATKRKILSLTLSKTWSFPLRISSVNTTKSTGNSGFGRIYWRNPEKRKNFTFCTA